MKTNIEKKSQSCDIKPDSYDKYLEQKQNMKRKSTTDSNQLNKNKSPTKLKKSPFVPDPNSPLPKRMQPKTVATKQVDDFSPILVSNNKVNVVGTVASKTRAGQNEHQMQKINQDIFIEHKNLNDAPNMHLYGVCDGHGQNGHLVSQFLKNTLPKQYIKNITNDEQDIIQLIKDIFLTTSMMLNKGDIGCDFSGSTCVTCLIKNDIIYTANVGDSRAILCRKLNEKWIAINLSYDQKPENPDEKKRIIKCGGRVEPFKDDREGFVGPHRVWFKYENYPGLAMSRSFGDKVAQKVGVISVPEIQQNQIKPEDKFIVICSDGVWEFLTNEQVMNMVIPHFNANTPQKACDKIITESVNFWKKEDEVIDDITVQIVFLKPQ